MNNTYWFKLITGEKIQVSEKTYSDWIDKHLDNIIFTSKRAVICIKKEQIVLGYVMPGENNEQTN